MKKILTPLTLTALVLGAMLLVAAEAPAGFPTGEVVWVAALAVLGFLIPLLLGWFKFSTWENRTLKTIFGYLISAVFAFIAAGSVRITTGAWPFEFNLAGLIGAGTAWIQFCYVAFVKKILENQGKA